MKKPLADLIRPKTLDQVVGQKHLLAPGKALYNLIMEGRSPILYFTVPAA